MISHFVVRTWGIMATIYSTALEHLFWVGTVRPLVSLSISQSSFTISDVALQMMKKQTNMIQAVPIFTKIFDTLKNRPESDKAIKIIANRTTTSTHETTQLFCYVTGNDTLTSTSYELKCQCSPLILWDDNIGPFKRDWSSAPWYPLLSPYCSTGSWPCLQSQLNGFSLARQL